MTLFTGYYERKLAVKILDNFYLDGWQAIHRISIAIM